jgi:hypothetical protein
LGHSCASSRHKNNPKTISFHFLWQILGTIHRLSRTWILNPFVRHLKWFFHSKGSRTEFRLCTEFRQALNSDHS